MLRDKHTLGPQAISENDAISLYKSIILYVTREHEHGYDHMNMAPKMYVMSCMTMLCIPNFLTNNHIGGLQ